LMIGAVLGAVVVAIWQSFTSPTEAEVIKRAWKSLALVESVASASTGDLVLVRDEIDHVLECRPDRKEFEDLKAALKLPQTTPWCKR
jgi:hypothetical protein